MKPIVAGLWTGLLACALARAESLPCDKVRSYRELLACAERMSPEVQRAGAELKVAEAQVGASKQFLNPEISGTSVYGKSSGENASETDIALFMPLELGGKRSSRIAIANGGVKKSGAQLFEARAKARAEAISSLHRARQILREQNVIKESLETFSKLVRQYESRPKLSPEQEVTLTVFRMAKADYTLRTVEVEEEASKIDAFFRINLGLRVSEVRELLPDVPKEWPKIEKIGYPERSPQLLAFEAENGLALAELNRAESDAWPTLLVGPSIKLVGEGERRDRMLGFNLSLPLPILSLNSGAKQAALAQVESASLRKGLAGNAALLGRTEQVSNYERSVAALATISSSEETEKRHRNVETLFLRGLVSGSLVIEAHRSMVELEKSRNERELKTIDAYLQIATLDGRIFEVVL